MTADMCGSIPQRAVRRPGALPSMTSDRSYSPIRHPRATGAGWRGIQHEDSSLAGDMHHLGHVIQIRDIGRPNSSTPDTSKWSQTPSLAGRYRPIIEVEAMGLAITARGG